jgi:hypothetical protein
MNKLISPHQLADIVDNNHLVLFLGILADTPELDTYSVGILMCHSHRYTVYNGPPKNAYHAGEIVAPQYICQVFASVLVVQRTAGNIHPVLWPA